jgi:uroporphyrinogen-III synthase
MSDEGPLAGAGVLVTRPAHQSAALLDRVADAGGQPLACPVLSIEWQEDETVFAGIGQLKSGDWLVAVSPNAVEALRKLRESGRVHWPELRYAAVGRGTADALERAGFAVSALPAVGEGAAALLDSPDFQGLANARVAIARGAGGRRVLDQGLTAAGADVLPLTLYRRVPIPPDPVRIETWLAQGELDLVMLHSGSAVEALLASLPPSLTDPLCRRPVVAPSERVLKKAAGAGFSGSLVEAADAGDRAMVAAAADWWQDNRKQA